MVASFEGYVLSRVWKTLLSFLALESSRGGIGIVYRTLLGNSNQIPPLPVYYLTTKRVTREAKGYLWAVVCKVLSQTGSVEARKFEDSRKTYHLNTSVVVCDRRVPLLQYLP